MILSLEKDKATVNQTWPKAVKLKPNIVTPTWALHYVLSEENIFNAKLLTVKD